MIPAGLPQAQPPAPGSPAPSPQALGVEMAVAAVRWQRVALSLARPGGCRKREMGRDEEKGGGRGRGRRREGREEGAGG